MAISIPVIVITGHGDIPMAVQAMKNGAIDFIQKPYRDQALLDSINTALARDRRATRPDAEQGQFDRLLATLTERESEVLDHLKKGKTSKEIAAALTISPRTAEVHRRNLLQELEVWNCTERWTTFASKLDPTTKFHLSETMKKCMSRGGPRKYANLDQTDTQFNSRGSIPGLLVCPRDRVPVTRWASYDTLGFEPGLPDEVPMTPQEPADTSPI